MCQLWDVGLDILFSDEVLNEENTDTLDEPSFQQQQQQQQQYSQPQELMFKIKIVLEFVQRKSLHQK